MRIDIEAFVELDACPLTLYEWWGNHGVCFWLPEPVNGEVFIPDPVSLMLAVDLAIDLHLAAMDVLNARNAAGSVRLSEDQAKKLSAAYNEIRLAHGLGDDEWSAIVSLVVGPVVSNWKNSATVEAN